MAGGIGIITRLTSRNLIIEFKPVLHPDFRAAAYSLYTATLNHVTVVNLNGNIAGTFKLAINGKRTAAITASASLASAAIQTIVDAVSPAPNTYVVSGAAGGPYTITNALTALNQFTIIEIVQDLTATGVTQAITSQGSDWIDVSGPLSSFSYNGTSENVDVTGISEKKRRHSTTVSDATFDLSIYENVSTFRQAFYEGVEGYMRVFEDGKTVGKRYFAWEVMLTAVKPSFKAFDKVEISVTGRRQGEELARVGSYWDGVI